uniref:NID domain-containing protein n=1 Tax=Ornithorhynchus anatinus TaxID=9258 RepID=F7F9A4_ORNAN
MRDLKCVQPNSLEYIPLLRTVFETQEELNKYHKNLCALNIAQKWGREIARFEEAGHSRPEAGNGMKFTSFEVSEDDKRVLDISCLFQEGQAFITFEVEEVAQNVIKKGKHLVNLEDGKVELEAKPMPLKTGVTFQFHVTVSQKKINVSNIPEELPREQMSDKLELSFCKSHEGGGEVESVDYDPRAQTAIIMFLEAGVAENILRNKVYPLKTNENCYDVTVSPYTETHLEKTILLTGLKDIQEEEEDLEDLVHIHFQKDRNGGGEVEVVKCALKQPLTVYFEEDKLESV